MSPVSYRVFLWRKSMDRSIGRELQIWCLRNNVGIESDDFVGSVDLAVRNVLKHGLSYPPSNRPTTRSAITDARGPETPATAASPSTPPTLVSVD